MEMARLNDDEIGNVQGNILRGYTLPAVRHMILGVSDRAAARAFLAASVTGGNPNVPQITTEQQIGAKLPKLVTAFNLGFTYQGLKALGLAPGDLASFPTEFIDGMTSRAAKLSDYGDSDPSNWPSPYHEPDKVHVIATAYAMDDATLASIQDQVSKAFDVLGVHKGYSLPNGAVYFGYKDGLSQPRFLGFHDGAPSRQDHTRTEEPKDPLGTILLGKPTRLPDLKFGVPQPKQFGTLGTFNAFRVLKQDCFGFENFLTNTAELLQRQGVDLRLVGVESVKLIYPELEDKPDLALREVIAAQLCGRWRNGMPMQLEKTRQKNLTAAPSNQFDYGDGALCPVGAHIRRNNPRGGEVVQRIANFTRRLVRRGMSYGDELDLAKPDDKERGLLGNFIGASLGAQFEAVMCDWLNLGLHSPDITGSNDPLLGANTPETSWFDLNLWKADSQTVLEKHRIYGLPRFVTTRGGAYTFLPSLTGIRYLSGLKG
jgi:deferrochelatase/peroxidase EfeB